MTGLLFADPVVERHQLTYAQRRNSCEWDPSDRVKWHAIGYETGLLLYADDNPADIQYGVDHYHRIGKTEHGCYELGVHDALVDRIAALETSDRYPT